MMSACVAAKRDGLQGMTGLSVDKEHGELVPDVLVDLNHTARINTWTIFFHFSMFCTRRHDVVKCQFFCVVAATEERVGCFIDSIAVIFVCCEYDPMLTFSRGRTCCLQRLGPLPARGTPIQPACQLLPPSCAVCAH